MVLRFIEDLKCKYKNELEDLFTNGYCYWFSVILSKRFDGVIYYLPIENHFITKINNRYYDITGEVDITGLVLYSWDNYKSFEPLDSERVKKYCIDKNW